jgi:hypothetical protein
VKALCVALALALGGQAQAWDPHWLKKGCGAPRARYPETTNLATFSGNFSSVNWAKTNVTVAAEPAEIAPDGAAAWKIADTATAAEHKIDNGSPGMTVSTGTPYARSVYAKAGTLSFVRLRDNTTIHSAVFNLGTGAVSSTAGAGSSATITEATGFPGWYRLTLVAPFDVSVNGLHVTICESAVSCSYAGAGGYVFAKMAQVELGSAATPYIETAAAAVTRPAGCY